MKNKFQNIKIGILQFDVAWQNKDTNLNKIKQILDTNHKEPDIVFLPEMFNTGFTLEPQKMAERIDGTTVKWLTDIAIEKKYAIGGSIVFEENNKFFNRFLFVTPEKKIHYYNKRHLFSLAGEQHKFEAGNKIVSVDYKGWRIRLLVCYDLRFPVWSRNTDNYDLAVYTANWPASRIKQWKALLIARAIENQAYVIGINRIGKDGNGFYYNGNSLVINPKGDILKEFPENYELFDIVELDVEFLEKSRKKFPFLKDADKFVINI